MFRPTALRAIPRSLSVLNGVAPRSILGHSSFKAAMSSSAKSSKASRTLSLALRQPANNALVRYQSTWRGDKKLEAEYGQQKLEALPQLVSAESSIHPAVGTELGTTAAEHDDVDMMAGIRSDFQTIVDTFSLKDVPREALYVGMAGVIPYLATSLTTVYLALDIQYAAVHGEGIFLSGETAEQLLHIVEPIQLGYGASIISFLGAIHWGLEWAGYGGAQGYPRYAIGIIATAVAWPTLLLSAEVGLITQFLAFTFLYYTDARASTRGWAPPWYATYRFVLTFVVGASIVASLIGRGQIADLIIRPPGPADRMRAIRDNQLVQLERQDAERSAKGGDADEEEEAEEEE